MNRSAIVAAGLCLAVLSGCGQTPEPSPPPPSEDALTTTAPDISEATDAAETKEPDGPPQMPEEATEQTEAGAEAFVAFYIDSLDYAYATGQTHTLPDLAGPDCDSCAALTQDLPSNPDGEQTFEITSSSAELIGDELARVEADLTVVRGPGAGDGSIVFDLFREDGSWFIDAIRLVQQP